MPGFRMLCGSYALLMPRDNGSDTTLGDQPPDNARSPAQDATDHELADTLREAIQALLDKSF